VSESPSTHLGHFGDESFQSVTCSGTDNQIGEKRENMQAE